MTDDVKIGVAMGDNTETFLKVLLEEVKQDEEVRKSLRVSRELEKSKGLTGEPITIGAVITGGTIVISSVLRLLERHLEHSQQRTMMRIVCEGFGKDPRLGTALAAITKKFADVSIRYGIAKEAWLTPGKIPKVEKESGRQ